MPIAPTQRRPAQLQVNTAGAWKTVVTFDASDDVDATKGARSRSGSPPGGPEAQLRITTTASYPVPLRHLGRNTYGLWIDTKEPQ
jgi:hypothetical protein